jgi:glycine cleavage system transcriptional repressor
MEKRYIMTAFGKDRVGIVADLTGLLFESGCNLEDSTMTRLSDEFVVVLLFSGPQGDVEEVLSKACRRLEIEKRITAFFRPAEKEDIGPKAPYDNKTLLVEGLDQAGIVYKVSRYLADNTINIANLASERGYSPESGTAFYKMQIDIEIPQEVSIGDLEEGLRKIGDDLNVDINWC